MRISIGKARGHKLKIPKILDIRPTNELLRQIIFDRVGERIKNAIILDLFAGAGTIGIEALSRGAKTCDFVDIDFGACQIITENLQHIYLLGRGRVFLRTAENFIKETPKQKYNIVILDPPYALKNLEKIIRSCEKVVKITGLVIVLHPSNIELPKIIGNLSLFEAKKIGHNAVSFLTRI